MRALHVGEREVAGQVIGYYLLADGGDEWERYGVRISSASGEKTEFYDLTVSGSRIEELLGLLLRNSVTPLALGDVVADWL